MFLIVHVETGGTNKVDMNVVATEGSSCKRNFSHSRLHEPFLLTLVLNPLNRLFTNVYDLQNKRATMSGDLKTLQ